MQPGALYLPASAPASLTGNGSNAVLAADLGSLRLPGEAATIFDARALTIAVYNGTDQAIAANGVQLTFSDAAVPGAVVTYAATNAAIAAGESGTAFVPVSAGVLAHLGVAVTFSAAPASGKVAKVRVTVEGPGAPVAQLTGSLAPLPSPGQIDLISSALGNTFTIAAGATYTSVAKNLLGNRKVCAYFTDAGGTPAPSYTLSVQCTTTEWNDPINQAITPTSSGGNANVGPIDIVTAQTTIQVVNKDATGTLNVNTLSLGVQ